MLLLGIGSRGTWSEILSIIGFILVSDAIWNFQYGTRITFIDRKFATAPPFSLVPFGDINQSYNTIFGSYAFLFTLFYC